MRIKIDPLDKLFSQFIRQRDHVCQRCLSPTNTIACAHFHGRSSKSVRWDEDNACGLCMGCHSYLDSHPMEKVEFFLQRLGQENFDALNCRLRQIWPRTDKKLLELYFREKIKEFE
jgi:hypothetical protein